MYRPGQPAGVPRPFGVPQHHNSLYNAGAPCLPPGHFPPAPCGTFSSSPMPGNPFLLNSPPGPHPVNMKDRCPGSTSRPACDSTTVDHMDLDINSITPDVTVTEEPCSSLETIDTVVVCAPLKKHGKRVYNKRHYCLYCSKPYAKMARHLESAHKNRLEVATALSFPTSSIERRKQLEYIRNKGNYVHNAAIMESGKGELVPFKRPSKEAKGNDFMHCAYCQGLFTRKVLWRHMQSCCLKRASVTRKPGRNRVQSMCTYTGPVPSSISKQLWRLTNAMIPDPITEIIKDDQVITDVGQHLLNKRGMSAKNQQCVRENMRELGRLIHNARRGTTLKKIEDFVNPKNYLEMVKTVKCTCGNDSDANKFWIPSLADNLGNSLVKVSKLCKAHGLIMNNGELVRNATQFQDVHREKWNELISATALRNIAEEKWNAPQLLPLAEDVQKMHQFLSQMHDECSSALSENSSTKAWSDLTKVCLTQIILFNRRRQGEVAAMPLLAFLSRDTTDTHEDVDWALSEVEKKLYRHFSRIVIRGKQGRPVPILLTPKMVCALELLVKYRESCGVLKDNSYLFARPRAMTHFRGSDCIRDYAKACHAKCPVSLTSTKLRKHAATLSTVLNMTDTEMDQLANFLGHDIRTHRKFYRLPEKTLQLEKISKVLMALEQGRLSEFHGNNLDEITIGGNESGVETEEDLTIEDKNCSFPDSEDGAFPTTEEEAIPPSTRLTQLSKEGEVSSGDRAVRHSSKEESAFPTTEEEEILPPNRLTQLSKEWEVSSGDRAVRHSSKAAQKRRPWTQKEVKAVEKHMKRFIPSGIVPGKSDCLKCLRAEPEALQNREWQALKFYVYNRITAYKRRLQVKE
ncbi:uncharacterized protein si:ch211-195b21.5 isoform X2 [Nerophis ophidion]|uniref:uncharacterized protein si:ch211-195b21.5 isoform X2 n=1 Tax=Nerophis ophidion TaxID=159077 RepID=UPI002AE06478|nr:uncharacterized protein si:ch211-195b21.5 isoform X2 [Nerophis ophidion]